MFTTIGIDYILEPVTCEGKVRLNNTKPLDLSIPQYELTVSLPSIPIVIRGKYLVSYGSHLYYCTPFAKRDIDPTCALHE